MPMTCPRFLKDPHNQLKILRVVNGLAVAGAMWDYFYQNPSAAALEYSFDIAVHVLQACVTESSSPMLKFAAASASALRGYQMLPLVGDTTMPISQRALDVGLHAANVYVTGQSMLKNNAFFAVANEQAVVPPAPVAFHEIKKRS